ncbi:MAG: FG-GAP-like repeat-containing protein, partial [Chitinophagaceae bacterium]
MLTIKNVIIVILVFITSSIIAQPTIQSFSPVNGKPSDNVVLTGTNFNATVANNIVFFGAAKATVTAATTTSLTVTVPFGASFAPISVLNTSTGLIAYSLRQFNPIYSPAKTSITTADFAAKQDFATGTGPFNVAVGDIDGDGKIDMVSCNQSSNSISVLRNTSTSSSINFASKQDYTCGSNPYFVAVFDADCDGKLDVVVANLGSSSISLFRNTSTIGNISFATKIDFTVGNSPRSIAVGDIDLDGKLDVAVTNQSVNTVSLLRNTSTVGNINFASKIDLTTGTRPTSIILNDIDGDNKIDVVVANQNSNNVSIFRNTSTTGNITVATKIDIGANTGAIAVAGGDLDGDNKTDLVVANLSSSNISVHKNTSTAGSISFDTKTNFTTGLNPISISIGDIDGNSKPDVSVANYGTNTNSVSFFSNTTSSSTIAFASKIDIITGATPISIATVDLNNDRRLDLITANSASGANSVSVLRNVFVPRTNANLSALAISAGVLTPTFNTNTTEYTINVPSNTTTFTVTPTAADSNATIRVNFNNGSYTTLASGSTMVPNTLSLGQNTIEVRVTAEDGTTVKSYALFINKPASTDANLSALTISVGTLSPVFDANTTTYSATVLSSTSVVTVTPTSNEPNATIRVNVNGAAYFATSNGSVSGGLVLNNGTNTINVEVTAQDGTTKKIYTITVTKPTDIADLIGLSITNGTLSPTFSGGITNYTISLPNTTSGIIIRPTALIFNSTIRYNINGGTFVNINSGANSSVIPINTGTNTINIQVTAADGITVKTYTIIVTRALSSNANLSNITFSTGFLSAGSLSSNTSFTSLQQNNITSVTFTPTKSDAGATIQYRVVGGSYTSINSGTASAAIALALGSNIVEILVTAQDGITTKLYTVDIIRASTDANLSNVTISAGSLTPVFAANITEYAV